MVDANKLYLYVGSIFHSGLSRGLHIIRVCNTFHIICKVIMFNVDSACPSEHWHYMIFDEHTSLNWSNRIIWSLEGEWKHQTWLRENSKDWTAFSNGQYRDSFQANVAAKIDLFPNSSSSICWTRIPQFKSIYMCTAIMKWSKTRHMNCRIINFSNSMGWPYTWREGEPRTTQLRVQPKRDWNITWGIKK